MKQRYTIDLSFLCMTSWSGRELIGGWVHSIPIPYGPITEQPVVQPGRIVAGPEPEVFAGEPIPLITI